MPALHTHASVPLGSRLDPHTESHRCLLQGSGAGRFNLTSVFDNATGGATHTFDCPSCGLLATSFLDVHLDISCQVCRE